MSLLLQLALGAGRWEEGCSSLLGRKGAAPGGKGVPACFGGRVSGGRKGVAALAETQGKTGLEVLELREL